MTDQRVYTHAEIGAFMRQARARALAAAAETEDQLRAAIRDARRRVLTFGVDMAEVDYLELELSALLRVRRDPNDSEPSGPFLAGQARRGVGTENYFMPLEGPRFGAVNHASNH